MSVTYLPRETIQRAFVDEAAIRAEISVTNLQISQADKRLKTLSGTEAVMLQRRIDGLMLWKTWLTEYLGGN